MKLFVSNLGEYVTARPMTMLDYSRQYLPEPLPDTGASVSGYFLTFRNGAEKWVNASFFHSNFTKV